ncbi:SEC-C motif-containing protein [Allocatelliglobosispora scoriae]|uniref:UPF0225 protein F4553_000446 n=1 Tax=Allocatelliglobosispora scoriae TaxID=643052 RepID=A0A841BD81_9ACTN|nr:YchJ family metal-binding protein [Allocatelliglobosispora scoriae]MBB5867067.1 SEC-C motif-containing protein [Allocatelliglobosispora scoriae]
MTPEDPRNQPGAPCPCALGPSYEQCCGRFHRGDETAPTAEQLMRSRYAAFVRYDVAYLLRTWHPTTRPAKLFPDDGPRYTGLTVLEQTGGALFDSEGTVQFEAHYTDGVRDGVLRENSRFVREDGQWLYVGPVA